MPAILTYVRGEAFHCCLQGLDPERRQTAMLPFAEAHATPEAKAILPLAAPIALNARVSSKLANWRDPATLAKLADAYERARDHEAAARLHGVTMGAARLAKRRYLDRAVANEPWKAPAESRPVAAEEFYLVARLVDLDAKAVEFDLMLPFVAGRHRFGALRMAGLDEPEEHSQSLDEPEAPSQARNGWNGPCLWLRRQRSFLDPRCGEGSNFNASVGAPQIDAA
jgi:hypothetical protein